MQYTKNYHLPQWVKEDRIMMDDFNQMCRDMEAGLDKNAGDAASASAAVSASAAAAQSTANAALAKANAAFSPSNFPYVLGTYVGNGSTLTVNLGFTPRFLIVAHQDTITTSSGSWPTGLAMAGMGVNAQGLTVESESFTVSHLVVNNGVTAPHINTKGKTYAYIAFR